MTASLVVAGSLFVLGARRASTPAAPAIEVTEVMPDERLVLAFDELEPEPQLEPAPTITPVGGVAAEAAPRPARAAVSEAPASRLRILVSLDKRMLWLVEGRDTLMSAPVAIGMGRDFEFEGKKYHFATPKGTRRVIGKQENPIWTAPEWHYKEKAARKGIELVRLDKDSKVELSDGSFIVVVEDQVGRVSPQGYFHPITPGIEIIWDDKIFIPPLHTAQRRVPDALGPYKLDTGNGYLIHGTHMYNEDSIGDAVSHGCIRMNNDDLEALYHLVPTGTPVEIF